MTTNLKTAKALGLTMPPQLLGRADEVIVPIFVAVHESAIADNVAKVFLG